MSSAPCSRRAPKPQSSGTSRSTRISASQATTIPFCPGESLPMGACTMGSRSLLLTTMILAAAAVGFAQSPTFGVGHTPTAEEVRAWDISIRPDGQELPQGHGTATEGAQLYVQK